MRSSKFSSGLVSEQSWEGILIRESIPTHKKITKVSDTPIKVLEMKKILVQVQPSSNSSLALLYPTPHLNKFPKHNFKIPNPAPPLKTINPNKSYIFASHWNHKSYHHYITFNSCSIHVPKDVHGCAVECIRFDKSQYIVDRELNTILTPIYFFLDLWR